MCVSRRSYLADQTFDDLYHAWLCLGRRSNHFLNRDLFDVPRRTKIRDGRNGKNRQLHMPGDDDFWHRAHPHGVRADPTEVAVFGLGLQIRSLKPYIDALMNWNVVFLPYTKGLFDHL